MVKGLKALLMLSCLMISGAMLAQSNGESKYTKKAAAKGEGYDKWNHVDKAPVTIDYGRGGHRHTTCSNKNCGQCSNRCAPVEVAPRCEKTVIVSAPACLHEQKLVEHTWTCPPGYTEAK